MSATQVTTVPHDRRAEVEAFYKRELDRDVPLGTHEDVLCAWEDGLIVGALRLFPASGRLVLRTMVVAEERRGRGIGRAMLRAASERIGERECYCFPWPHLERFYGEIGFRPIDRQAVPPELLPYLGPGIATLREARP